MNEKKLNNKELLMPDVMLESDRNFGKNMVDSSFMPKQEEIKNHAKSLYSKEKNSEGLPLGKNPLKNFSTFSNFQDNSKFKTPINFDKLKPDISDSNEQKNNDLDQNTPHNTSKINDNSYSFLIQENNDLANIYQKSIDPKKSLPLNKNTENLNGSSNDDIEMHENKSNSGTGHQSNLEFYENIVHQPKFESLEKFEDNLS